jgi:S-DNA-T family DNA segregation ATPase FtsK/SpoIIIE
MSSSRGGDLADDPIYIEAMQFVMENGKVSISLLQRRFRIGFNRAARFVEQMEKDGILGQADGTRPRTVNR